MLFIFDTHPIQYRAPVFRALFRIRPDLKVFFFNEAFDSRKWWFQEVGKTPPQKWDIELRPGYPSAVLAPGGLGKFLCEARRILTTDNPKAVVIYGYYLPEHWILWALCQWYRIPLIFIGETFSMGGGGIRRRIKSFWQPLFLRGIRRFVSIGEKSRNFYRQFGISDDRIVPAKYCVDNAFFQLSPESGKTARQSIRRSLGISEDAFVLLFVGRLFERKRPLDAIKIKQSLADKTIPLIVIGNGLMEAEVKSAVGSDSSIYLVGFKNQPETRDFYYAADLLIVPSELETWGLVVNEACAAAVPAAVTENCGVANELVVTGESGLVYPVGEIQAVVAFIETAIKNPVEYEKLRRRAREKVLTQYSIEQFAAAIAKAALAVAKSESSFL